MMAMPSVYNVALPKSYTQVWDHTRFLQKLGITSIIAPSVCHGGFHMDLYVIGYGSFGVVCGLLLTGTVWTIGRHAVAHRGAGPGWPLKEAVLKGVPSALAASFFLVPVVSTKIFAAFDCVGYSHDSAIGDVRYYVRDDPRILCFDSNDHNRIRGTAFALMIIWPIGAPLVYGLLLLSCRNAIQNRKPSPLSSATDFLHKEYTPQFYYWEVLELVRRIVLNGALLLIKDEQAFLRIVAALAVSSCFVLFASLCKPMKNRVLNYVQSAGLFGVLVVMQGALMLKLMADIAEEAGDDVVQKVLAFDNAESAVLGLLGFVGVVVAAVVLVTIQEEIFVARGELK